MNININIRLLTGRHHIFQVKENSTIYDLKSQASSVFSIPVDNLAFIYKSIILNNNAKIKDINYDQEHQNSFIIAANTLLTGDLKNIQDFSKNRKADGNSNNKYSIPKERKKNNPNKKDKNGNTIPWNIDSLINFIVNLHYSAHYARLALEYTKYDLHRAIYLLSTGRAIGPDGREHSCNIIGIGLSDSGSIPGSSFNSKGGYGTGNVNSSGSIDYGSSDNYDRNSYMNYEETEESATVPVRRTVEEKKLAETMKEFTEEERQAIARLCYGRDRSIVVQVFIACDKDEALTESCLSTMN